jgi:hypothetical protein
LSSNAKLSSTRRDFLGGLGTLALNVNATSAEKSIEVVENEIGDGPFSAQSAPVRLKVKARKLTAWRAEDGAANAIPESPVISDQPEETIELIPYAAAKLRITAFPQCES